MRLDRLGKGLGLMDRVHEDACTAHRTDERGLVPSAFPSCFFAGIARRVDDSSMLGMPVTNPPIRCFIIGTGAVAYPSWTIDWWREPEQAWSYTCNPEGKVDGGAQRFSLLFWLQASSGKPTGPLCTGSLT